MTLCDRGRDDQKFARATTMIEGGNASPTLAHTSLSMLLILFPLWCNQILYMICEGRRYPSLCLSIGVAKGASTGATGQVLPRPQILPSYYHNESLL